MTHNFFNIINIVLLVNLGSPIIINHLRIMSFYSSCEVDFQQMLSSEAKKDFYKKPDISSEEQFFCREYARFQMGKACCYQFVSLINAIGKIELAKKVTEVAESKFRIKSYSSEKELFGDILNTRMDLQMMEMD